MKPRFQFSLKACLVATAWLAAWLANLKWAGSMTWFWSLVNEPDWTERHIGQPVCIFLHVLIPAAFVGAITRRQIIGLLCGVASGAAILAFDWLTE
jgi:hypothetical protein